MSTPPEMWERANELFLLAVERPPAERERFLDDACGGDSALRREVVSLLEFDNDNESFIETPALVLAPTLLLDALDESLAVETGHIGPYRVVREIGRGGMGAVYLAERDDEEFRKSVAIKLVKRGLDTEDILRHFRHERQILASLDHPNIAKLLDGGTTRDGRPYLVMDYVEGVPVTRYCDEHELETEDRLRLFVAVCSAVHYAHQNLVIHRDIKPGNVLVAENGVPKLLDFGIAKLLDKESLESKEHPVTMMGVMTPDYASPEQLRGEHVTTASDVYSLGVLLYELLSGQRPYQLKSRRPEDMARIICESELQKPSTAMANSGLRDLDAASPKSGPRSEVRNPKLLRGDLDNIVLMAMRKEPARRYSSVAQFSEDISRHLEGLPVIARPDTLGYRSSKFIRRHKWGVVAAVIVALALAGGLTVAMWQAKVAAGQRDRARAEAQKADQSNRFLREMLASADPNERGKDVTVAQMLGVAAKRVENEFRDQPEAAAALRSTIGMTYLGLGLFDDAEPHLRSALDMNRSLFGNNHPEVASSMNNLAQLLAEQGKIPEAEGLYREALDVSRRTRGPDAVETAAIMHNLGALLLLKGALDEAEQTHRDALAIRRRGLGNDHEDVAQSLNDLGVVLGTKGDLPAAEQLHREALEIMRRVYGAEHPNVAATLGTIAAMLEEKGEYTEAEALYLEALEMRRKLLGREHPTVAWTLYNYAYMLWRKGDYQKATQLAREVLELRGKALNDEHPMVASSLQVLGRSLVGQGNAKAAEPILRESLALRRKTMPPGHWLIAASESVLGECLTAQKRYVEAEALLLNGYNALKSALGEQHPRTREAHQRLVRLHDLVARLGSQAARLQ